MQLSRSFRAAALATGLILAASATFAQSLSPMRGEGPTPSAAKAFRLTISNPYKQRMTFVVDPMDTNFVSLAKDSAVQPRELVLAPGFSRTVLVSFKIDPQQKERSIGVCVYPKDLPGHVLPRVCGTYSGRMVVRPSR